MDVGFLGLGRMGRAMAANLVKAGHTVRVWNRSPEAARGIDGATPVATPAEAFRGDAAITMLADDAALRSVIVAGGLLDAPERPAVHVSMSTIAVALAQELAPIHARAGVAYVAAPVFGRPDAAANAALNIVAAGDDAAIATVQPLLDAMGTKTWCFGPEPYRANAVKLAGNFMLISAIEAMGEASAFAEGHGVPAASLLDLLTNTLFASPVYKGYGALIAERRYEPPGFSMRLGAKDIRLVLAAAETAGVPMPFAGILRDNFIDAISHGDGDKDFAALATVAARRSGQL
ncbi:NAD(P)-dependent oxidoreductase [Methylobacterium haplocladii]|uniref:Oxidoreductase n=1 Tax=Methylobacterium haplocladii TaxID=1176176 RepID=A0A512IMU3_9HYPH|nr:NAD(P)-dependent oxidoreductase [Methylobacterium haplocladii]GEO99033.1 oxidoreductase [Methylobacterium haplocladii]GJD84120.1 2-hydroxy-3-oxopropionate reductase [Methylobacterium haplocladii]GLS58967.1 oxidoreductase [Methylobacterium haplocladii]